jgi:hypothetical protein
VSIAAVAPGLGAPSLLPCVHRCQLNGHTLAHIHKVVWLFASSGRLLIADSRMGGIGMQGTRSAGNDGEIYGDPPNQVDF